VTALERERIDAFIDTFFGAGNTLDAIEDPGTKAGQRLTRLLQMLRQPSDVPVVLPRRFPQQPDHLCAYVIAWDPAHATMVSELLTAFVGPTYSYFNGLPARLDADDPIELAIIDFVGPNTTFILRSPTDKHEGKAWAALDQMQRAVARRGVRNWHIPKPVGRLLGEFEVALAAGDNSSSAAILNQLAATGGLGGANLAHLRIKRLSKIGRNADLLRLPGIADVIAADPPAPVRDAILGAIYHETMPDALDNDDLVAAEAGLAANAFAIPRDLQRGAGELGSDALWVVLLAAHLRRDFGTTRLLLEDTEIRGRLGRHPNLVAACASALPTGAPAIRREEAAPTALGIDSWTSLAHGQAAGDHAAAAVLREETWREWPKPHTQDHELAAVLADLDNAQAQRCWQMLGAFLDADDFGHPAARTASVFLEQALVHNWFSPADLAGIVALAEIVLRSSPDRAGYALLLDGLGADTERWVSSDRALVALDLADLLTRMPCPDDEARLRLAVRLLGPIAAHATRLDDDLRRFAQQLDHELGTTLTWPQLDTAEAADESPTLGHMPALKVLLYSLDEAALDRTRAVLLDLFPQLNIRVSSDHVGSSQLKQQTQHSDVVVLATRCATHAATGFIRAHMSPDAVADEADGCGSASLLRATTIALEKWLSQHRR